MKGKAKENNKTKQISADLNVEDYALLERVMSENNLSSKREGFNFIFKGYLQSLNPNTKGVTEATQKTCEALSPDGKYCCYDLKVTNPSKCKACLQQKALEEELEKAAYIKVRLEDKKSGYAEKVWLNLTGTQLGIGDFSQSVIKIQQKILDLNSELDWLRNELSTCPKCGYKIPLDDIDEENKR